MQLLVISNGKRRLVPTTALRPGKEGNLQTLAVLLPMIRADAESVELRRFVLGLIADLPNTFEAQVGVLFDYAKNSIRYTRDPIGAERIADAATTIDEQAGDCGDKSILLAAMLATIGYLSRLIALNFYDDLDAHGYDHLLVQVQDDAGAWQSLDPTPEDARPNWEPAAPVRTVFPIWEDGGGQKEIAGGPLDALIAQGIQIGSQYAAGAVQSSQRTHAQEAQLGSQFDNLAGQVTALFNQIQALPVITLADLQTAAAAYQQLAQIAQENATAYITEQWNSVNYKPAYEARLNQMAEAVSSEQLAVSSQTSAEAVLGLPSSVGSSLSSLLSNPLALVAGALFLVAAVKRRG
jgi:hypothetical protein